MDSRLASGGISPWDWRRFRSSSSEIVRTSTPSLCSRLNIPCENTVANVNNYRETSEHATDQSKSSVYEKHHVPTGVFKATCWSMLISPESAGPEDTAKYLVQARLKFEEQQRERQVGRAKATAPYASYLVTGWSFLGKKNQSRKVGELKKNTVQSCVAGAL